MGFEHWIKRKKEREKDKSARMNSDGQGDLENPFIRQRRGSCDMANQEETIWSQPREAPQTRHSYSWNNMWPTHPWQQSTLYSMSARFVAGDKQTFAQGGMDVPCASVWNTIINIIWSIRRSHVAKIEDCFCGFIFELVISQDPISSHLEPPAIKKQEHSNNN